MSNPVFQPATDSMIDIPTGINGGMYRVTGAQRSIPFAPFGDPLLTANSFGQVQAVKDVAKKVCAGPGGAGVICNGFSRVSLWLTRMIQPLALDYGGANIPLIAAGAQVPLTPPPFDIQLRWASGNISETLFQATVTPAAWTDHGLLAEVSGVQADQIELWARIPNQGAASVLSFSVYIQWSLTSHSNNSIVPVVGNIVTVKAIQQYV
jgi:hypothetical protein